MKENKKNTILIIDSDSNTAESLSGPLKSIGFSIISVSNVEMAYKLFMNVKPDIILLDLHIDGNRGCDLFLRMHPKASSEKIPIIISSKAGTGANACEFPPEANDYISKPLHPGEVITRINTQLKIVNIQKELEKKNKELQERNSILQQMAITDTLTGLYNRGYILNKLSSDIAHSIRYKEPISFILADIDHFKKINDKYGHQSGDSVLKEAATIIKASVREVDIVTRYGGEEFLIICPNTDEPGAANVAERVREHISAHRFSITGRKIRLTISMGIKSTVFEAHISTDEAVHRLIEDADKAMYAAKAKGRNRVVVSENIKDMAALRNNHHISSNDNVNPSAKPGDKFLN